MKSLPEAIRPDGGGRRLTFIGCGNPLRGDDAAGLCAVRALQEQGIPAIETQQLTPELAETISRTDVAVFLDATVEIPPGNTRAVPIRPGASSVLGHASGPGELLRIAHDVYGRAPEAWLLEVGVQSCDLGGPVSAPVRRGIAELVDRCAAIFFGRTLDYNQV